MANSQGMRRIGLAAGGAVVYISATAAAYLYFYEPKEPSNKFTNDDRLQVFNANAKRYNQDIGWDEHFTGISLMRRMLLKKATGSTLEVAAGTGRNVDYYPAQVQKLMLTDFSPDMLEQAPTSTSNSALDLQTKVMSADNLEFNTNSFDTVVDTFGLCSVDDPVQALQELQRVAKPNAKILLLEHGRSHYHWLSSILDKFAPAHLRRWGCEWNRDMLQVVDDAGLQVETVHRFHFGTTYYIVAKPSEKKQLSEHEMETET